MAYCSNCGAKLNEGANFCHVCGNCVLDIKKETAITTDYKRSRKNNSKQDNTGCKCPISFIGSVLGIILLCSIALNAVSTNDSKSTTTTTPTTVSKSTTTSTKTVTPTKPNTTTPKFKQTTETISNWKITVKDYKYVQSIDVGLLHEYNAESGNKYCVVDVKIQNIGTEIDTFLPWITFGDEDVKLTWGEYEFTRSELLFADIDYLSDTLNPLVTAEGQIVFQVPNAVANSNPTIIFSQDGETFECELIKTTSNTVNTIPQIDPQTTAEEINTTYRNRTSKETENTVD